MAQLNLNLSPQFEKQLKDLMRVSGISTKSDAIRKAVEHYLETLLLRRRSRDWDSLIGFTRELKRNPKPRFHSDDDLWS